jgi:hypothetical protein
MQLQQLVVLLLLKMVDINIFNAQDGHIGKYNTFSMPFWRPLEFSVWNAMFLYWFTFWLSFHNFNIY